MELTYHETMDVLDIKSTNATSVGYTLPNRKYEISDITLMLKYLFLDEVEVNITIDQIRLKSNLATKKPKRLPKKIFLYIFRFCPITLRIPR